MSLKLRTLLAPLLALAVAGPAFGAPSVIIDNFEEGDFSLEDSTATSGPTTAEQSGLATSNVAGASRLVTASATGVGTFTAAANLATAPVVDDSVVLTAVSGGNFSFNYDAIADGAANGSNGLLNLDLTGLNQIRVDLPAVIGTGVELRVTLWDMNTQTGVDQTAVQGANVFLFSAFPGIDIDDIRAIRVSLNGISPTSAVSMSRIVATPEPGTGLLLAAGLLGMAARRRSSR